MIIERVDRAIENSKKWDKISHVEAANTDELEALQDALMCECEDYDVTCLEFWGVDVDGNDWRVHLS